MRPQLLTPQVLLSAAFRLLFPVHTPWEAGLIPDGSKLRIACRRLAFVRFARHRSRAPATNRLIAFAWSHAEIRGVCWI